MRLYTIFSRQPEEVCDRILRNTSAGKMIATTSLQGAIVVYVRALSDCLFPLSLQTIPRSVRALASILPTRAVADLLQVLSGVFPGSNTPVSSDENPSNICYNTPGTYEVELTVTSASGENTLSTDNFITVGNGTIPVIDLSYPEAVCQSGGSVSPAINPGHTTGGQFSSSNGLSLNSETGEINVSESISGDYTITYTVPNTSCGGTEPVSSSYTISIDSVSTISVSVSGSLSICLGETVQLTAQAGFSNYVWSNQETGNSISVSQTGNYAVSAENANNCNGFSDTVRVTVVSPPIASYTYQQQQGYVVDFTNTSQGATSFLWNFGSGFTSTESDPSYNFLFDNTWPVSLIVENECGSDTLNSDVIVIKTSGFDEMSQSLFSFSKQPGCILIACKTIFTEEIKVSLLSVSGQLLYDGADKFAGKQSLIVPVSTLPRGIYILRLQTRYGILQRKLFLENQLESILLLHFRKTTMG
jgi:PKD repeat protein